MMSFKRKKSVLILLIIFLTNSINLRSFEYGKQAFNSMFSSLGTKSYAAILSLSALSAYYIFNKKSNAAAQLKQENDFIAKNLKITKDTIFVFDINDVIIKNDFQKISQFIKQALTNHKLNLFSALIRPYMYYLIFKEISKGGVPEEILTKIQETYPQFSDLTYLGLEIANAQKEVPGMFALLEKLHKDGHELLLLSNVANEKIDKEKTKDSSFEMLKKQFPIFNLFNMSASLLTLKEDNYLKKPNDKFFKKFKDKFKTVYPAHRIKDIVFVDDRLKNIIPARKEGISSVWFISSEDLIKKLNNAQGIINHQNSLDLTKVA